MEKIYWSEKTHYAINLLHYCYLFFLGATGNIAFAVVHIMGITIGALLAILWFVRSGLDHKHEFPPSDFVEEN